MRKFKLTFNNGETKICTEKNLNGVHERLIPYLEKNNLTSCLIKLRCKVISNVIKDGSWHWNHNGYKFC